MSVTLAAEPEMEQGRGEAKQTNRIRLEEEIMIAKVQ